MTDQTRLSAAKQILANHNTNMTLAALLWAWVAHMDPGTSRIMVPTTDGPRELSWDDIEDVAAQFAETVTHAQRQEANRMTDQTRRSAAKRTVFNHNMTLAALLRAGVAYMDPGTSLIMVPCTDGPRELAWDDIEDVAVQFADGDTS